MEPWLVIFLVALAVSTLLLLAAWLLWRKASARTRGIASRVQMLPWRSKLRLARNLMADERIPLRTRLILPGIVLYLAMPLDIVPDFLPVIGQLDDVLVVAVGVALLIRSASAQLLEAHISALEAVPRS